MTQNEINLYERVAWLDRKMVRTIWGLSTVSSLFVGWVVSRAVFGDSYGWAKAGVFLATWLILNWIMIRMELKGAPKQTPWIVPTLR